MQVFLLFSRSRVEIVSSGTGPIKFYAHAADLVNVDIFTICLQMPPDASGRAAFMRTLRTW